MSERDELEDLSTPVLELAAGYGRAGLRVFPVDMRPDARGKPRKAPLHGYLWKERATSKISEIVEDVLEAIERIGEANVGIGWALGLDGCLALDLDGVEPAWWTDLLPAEVAVNVTARGLHLIYRQPDGRRIGNGTAGFPSRGWGEVRGHGGYIVVAGPDRPGFDVAQLERVVPFPRPEWLSDAGAEAIDLDDAELEAWLEERSGFASLPGKVAGYRTRLGRWRAPESRHDTALEVACWMMREAAAELVDTAEALEVLGAWWIEVGRIPGRTLTLRELASVIRWAVGVTIADPARVAEIRARQLGAIEVDISELVTVVVGELSTYDVVDIGDVIDGKVINMTANLLTLDDGRALLHRHRLNEIHGDSGSGKSWLLAVAIAELLDEGSTGAIIDFESDPSTLIRRLRQIGVSDEAMRERLVYFRPSEPMTEANALRVVEQLRARGADHLFIDSLGEAFAMEGIDENSDADVTPWYGRAIRPIIEAGIGVTIVDHITKAGDMALHPSGSKRKRAEVDGTSWLVVALEPWTVAEGGRLALRCGKDRHGAYRRGGTIAYVDLSPIDDAGRSVVAVLALGVELEDGTTVRRDPLDVLVEALEVYGEHNMSALEGLMRRVAGWSRAEVRSITALAVKRGLVIERRGTSNARLFAGPPTPPANHGGPANTPEA